MPFGDDPGYQLNKFAVFFEDLAGSINSEIDVVERHGYENIIVTDLLEFLDIVEANKDAIFFVDMNFKSIGSMAELNCPDIVTPRGEAVGSALFAALRLNDVQIPQFAYLLTGRPVPEKARETLRDLELEDKISIPILKKGHTTEFEQQVVKHLRSIEKRSNEICRKLDVIDGFFSRVIKNEKSVKAAYGFPVLGSHSVADVKQRFSENVFEGTADHESRMELLVYVIQVIETLLGPDDVESHKEWFFNQHKMLDNRSPWSLVKTGALSDLALLAAYLRPIQ